MTIFKKYYCKYLNIMRINLQKTSKFRNFISVFKAYNQCITKPEVATKVAIYYLFS